MAAPEPVSPLSARVRGAASAPTATDPTKLIAEETARACVERFGSALSAVVLTGSLARDEGTFAREDDALTLLGDAEFVLVFHDGHALPGADVVAGLLSTLETRLQESGLRGTIGLSPCHTQYLADLGPQIFAYELRACGRVAWGDRDVLAFVPRFSAAELDREDAWRLLNNRLVEQLGALADEGLPDQTAAASVRYRTAKLWLDMATSYLVFAGGYAPSYRARADVLSSLARRPAGAEAPFDLDFFARRVRACTSFKLGTTPAGAADEMGSWREAAWEARRLWRWELSRLTGASADLSDRTLRELWMRRQPLAARARGWAYAVRRHGWHRSWRHWPRWARLARRGSPRHWIYGAATELLFALASPAGGTTVLAGADLRELARALPLGDAGPRDGWRAMAAHVYRAYQDLLVETRA